MEWTLSEEFPDVIKDILKDYATTCDVEPFHGQVIIAEDMAEAYSDLRGDLIKKGKVNLKEIPKYNGITVQPKEVDGDFTILLNENYIFETEEKNNVDWVGTLVHEATHVNDFKDYFKIILPKSYDELYEYNPHRMFLYWTEFHAKVIGYYFLRKYALKDFKSDIHVNNIAEIEIPFQIDYMAKELGSTTNCDRQMYVVMHFLGRLAVWQYLYPNVFNDEYIYLLTQENKWMSELYYFLIKYPTLEKIYPHFDEMEEILDKYFLSD